jgi:hypothetical protein
MDFSRVRTGELIAGVSGVALFIFMFFKWFGVETPEFQTPAGGIQFNVEAGSASAWSAFDFIDIVLLLAVIAAVGLVVLSAAQASVNLPVAASAITAGLGILATLLVLYRIIDPPDLVEGLDETRKIGVFLGVVACAGIALGGWMAMQEEGTTFAGEADRFGGGGGPGPGEPPPPPPPSTGP